LSEEIRIMAVEKRQDDHDARLRVVENLTSGMVERLRSIDEKMDILISSDAKIETRFQEKSACSMVRDHVRADVQHLGDSIRTLKVDFENHQKAHVSKTEKALFWIVTTILAGLFSIDKLIK